MIERRSLPELAPHSSNGGNVGHERNQCDVAGPLNRKSQSSLMLGTDPGTEPGFYLRSIGNEPAYPVHVLVVDVFDVVDAEGAYLPSGSISATGASATGPPAGPSAGTTRAAGTARSTTRSAEWR